MKLRLGELKRLVREALGLDEETWPPGRYYPGAEHLDGSDRDRLNQPLGEDDDEDVLVVDEGPPGASLVDPHPTSELDEVDTDPSNNPGRPDDPYDYIGMHPKPEAAMAHPFAGGAAGGGESGADPSEPPDEPEGGT
jgi:hypothetical protein